MDSSVPISDLSGRRRSSPTPKKHRTQELVDAELSGYRTGDDFPDYRTLQPETWERSLESLGRMVSNVQIPVSLLPDNVRKFAEEMVVAESVKEIETLSARAAQGNIFRQAWPPEYVILARDHVKMDDGSILVEAWKPLTQGRMEGILDQVRNRLLDFLLELQQVSPDVMTSDDAIRAFPQDAVQNIFNTTILGGQNVIATGTSFTQKVSQSVKIGDFRSLRDHLQNLGIPADALAELDAALAKDGERPRGKLGEA